MYLDYSTFIEIIALAIVFGFSAGIAFKTLVGKIIIRK